MAFDKDHNIHFESVDRSYAHLEKLERINRESFPDNEYFPLEALLKITDLENGHINAVVDGDEVIGFMVFFHNDAYLYLLFFAIDKNARSLGYGSKILKLLFDTYRDHNCFGSIEHLISDAPNYEQRVARKKFYDKNSMTFSGYLLDNGPKGFFQLISSKGYLDIEPAMNFLTKTMSELSGKTQDEIKELFTVYKKIEF